MQSSHSAISIAPKTRHYAIDLLRAVSIIGVVIIHVFIRHYGPLFINVVWNYLQFVVVTFVFCSGYLMAMQYEHFPLSHNTLFAWYHKRFRRLYVPYLYYAAIHFLLFLILPSLFHGVSFEKSSAFIFRSITLSGGIDLGWLTLLFIQLALIAPFLLRFFHIRLITASVCIFLGVVTALFTLVPVPSHLSRAIAWLPWTLVLLVSIAIGFYEKKHGVGKGKHIALIAGLIGLAVFFQMSALLGGLEKTTSFVSNKYPPNLFYLSYGIGITGLLYWLAHFNLWKNVYIHRAVTYISRHAYILFFVHYIVLDGILSAMAMVGYHIWWLDLILVFAVSVGIVAGIERMKKPLLLRFGRGWGHRRRD